MTDIGKRIGRQVTDIVRPSKDENVIMPGPGKPGRHLDFLSQLDQDFVIATLSSTMDRLGFRRDVVARDPCAR